MDSAGDLFVTNHNSTVRERPGGSTMWQNITNGGQFKEPAGIAVDSAGDVFVTNNVNDIVEEYHVAVWTPPLLMPEPVTVGGVSTAVIGNLGDNSVTSIKHGTFVGYVEERAAILAGAYF